jgi:hypothetical protein
MWVILLIICKNARRFALLLSLFYRWGKRVSEKLAICPFSHSQSLRVLGSDTYAFRLLLWWVWASWNSEHRV